MVAKKFQNPSGGLNDAGRKKFGVKSPVSSGKNPRRISFAARFSKVKGPYPILPQAASATFLGRLGQLLRR